jgi:hypothetical protein
MRPVNQVPAHWSKDFVEHLRTVHFTLIALCLGLIVLAFFPSKFDIKIAHEQALEILRVTNAWDPRFIEAEAAEVVQANVTRAIKAGAFVSVTDQPSANEYAPDSTHAWIRPIFKPPMWVVKIQIPDELSPGPPPFSEESPRLAVNAPRSIASFRRFWDSALAQPLIILPLPPNSCLAEPFSHLGRPAQECRVSKHDPSRHPEEVSAYFQVSSKRLDSYFNVNEKWDYEFRVQSSPTSTTEILLPIRTVAQMEFDEQNALVKRSTLWSNKHKMVFKDAFHELAAVDEPFEDADIATSEKILAAEARREGDAFEAVGMKIPAEIALQFGVLFVLGVQLYMWIHLHEFGNRIERDAGFDVAWIGVYFSRPAQFVFLASLLLLPWATVIILSYKWLHLLSDRRRLWWAIAIVANLASLVLSYLIIRVLPKATASEVSDNTPV